MTGYVAIHRQLFDHPVFKRERFSEREAWAWLIAEAAWQERRKRSGRAVVELRRGQLSHSRRFMARAWQWTDSRVYRFLEKLRLESMVKIEPVANHETSIITICNYDKFQTERTSGEPATEPPPNQWRTKLEEGKKERIEDGGERAPLVGREAVNLANEVAIVCGHDPEFVPPEWMGAAWTAQRWLNEGWGAAAILAACKETMARKRDGPPSRIEYFEKPIAKFIARQSAPLPKVEIVQGETIHVVQGPGRGNSGSVVAAADRLVQRLAEFDKAPDQPGVRGGTGENIVRLLPQRGGERS